MDEKEVLAYNRGKKSVWLAILKIAQMECGMNTADPFFQLGVLITERNEAISALREVCRIYGDNDWPDELYLSDIINKHIKQK